MVREAEARPYQYQHVVLTLADGTKLKGYVADVGYAGLRLMVHGSTAEWRFSAIKSIRSRRRWWRR